MRSNWGHVVCSAWRRGEKGEDSLQLQLPQERKRRGTLISSLWSPVTGPEGMPEVVSGRFRLDNRKRFFTQRVEGHWNELPWEVITALCLTEFRKHLDNALSHRVWLLGIVLCRAGRWTCEIHSKSGYSVILWWNYRRYAGGQLRQTKEKRLRTWRKEAWVIPRTTQICNKAITYFYRDCFIVHPHLGMHQNQNNEVIHHCTR